jgi:hypothetical protein
LDASFCVDALEAALQGQRPEIFNTDQGAQFTSVAFTGRLLVTVHALFNDLARRKACRTPGKDVIIKR